MTGLGPQPPRVIGIDIGGANLKYADTDGHAFAVQFPLWKCAARLSDRLVKDLTGLARPDAVAVTMTGELADCFLDRAEGVIHIVRHATRAITKLGGCTPRFYGVDGSFHDAAEADQRVDLLAASNWHALGLFVARFVTPRGTLVDIGSTTTDLIPVVDRSVGTTSRTDHDRLREGSLVYVGAGRTPVCSLVDQLSLDGARIGIMREVFATMDDCRLLLGHEPVDGSDGQTADGKPRDVFHAANRLARMVGLDHRSLTIDQASGLARQVHARARRLIADGFDRVHQGGDVVVSGYAADLAEDLGQGSARISLDVQLGRTLSRSAPAYAVARLLQECIGLPGQDSADRLSR
ncbi:tetrahydromethanopterin-linked C1 transfer pathway [Roseiconus nitratireducens]|uniref:Tetrahydromethanopterin-linked C1 transfer pathway n=1 Tax=Roseiconus nitratireducens TaxID=2605748 RepID=A0A5M6DDV9_9BACT|nr:hydantoinase/oxoprolinase family protein [Roseiconus nitratireducens]KAA5544309.1 tetrahydromethanopterin-linked C1 transfer pathway [Roseiconus nitratireducens]